MTKLSAPNCEKLLGELRAKQQSHSARCEHLREQKNALLLEAHGGDADARKQVDRLNAELTKLALEVDDLLEAVAQAEGALKDALRRESEMIARMRMQDVAAKVPEVLDAARQYSAGLDAAVAGARKVKRLIAEIGELVLDQTTKHSLDRLLGGVAQNPFELNAIHSGLKEFVALRGEPAHSDRNVRLEENLRAALESLVEQAKRYAELPAEDRALLAELDAPRRR